LTPSSACLLPVETGKHGGSERGYASKIDVQRKRVKKRPPDKRLFQARPRGNSGSGSKKKDASKTQ